MAGLGAFHGVNPAMGWLFAVGIGLQEGRRRALLHSLLPIALGHALSVSVVVAVVSLVDSVVTRRLLAVGGGALLVGFGISRIVRARHPRWVGMRLSRADLVLWSFLMSSAHGAGLMLFPLLVDGGSTAGPHAHHAAAVAGQGAGPAVAAGLATAALHSAAMLAVMATVALFVYEVVGLDILRRAWVNLDRVWAFVLVGAGAFAIFS